MHALEGVLLVDFGQYLAGPFGPMIIGDLGAEVIKVEPVTGDGMRLGGQAVLRAAQRGKRDIAPRPEDRARATRSRSSSCERADIVHHNMTAGRREAARDRVRRLQARQPRRRVLQHLGVRPRRPARALRRARPALPGGGRPRVRGGSGARRQQAALHPLRDDRHGQRDAVGGRVPRRAVPPAPDRRGPGAVDVAARRRRDARRPTRCSSTATPFLVHASTPTSRASTRATGCTERSTTTGSRSPRSEAEQFAGLCAALGLPELVDDARASRIGRPARAPPPARGTASRRVFATRTAIVWSRLLDDEGVPNEIPRDMNAGEACPVRRRPRTARSRRRVRPPDRRPHAAVRRS